MDSSKGSLRDIIDEQGHAVISVKRNPENGAPAYTYTVGLCLKGQPEILIVGNLHPQMAGNILNVLSAEWKAKGKELIGPYDGLRATDAGDTVVRAEIIEVSPGEAMEHYAPQLQKLVPECESPSFVQFLWADQNNKLPHEPGYDHENCPQTVLTRVQ